MGGLLKELLNCGFWRAFCLRKKSPFFLPIRGWIYFHIKMSRPFGGLINESWKFVDAHCRRATRGNRESVLRIAPKKCRQRPPKCSRRNPYVEYSIGRILAKRLFIKNLMYVCAYRILGPRLVCNLGAKSACLLPANNLNASDASLRLVAKQRILLAAHCIWLNAAGVGTTPKFILR